jgi:hypothetical protein
MRTALLLALLPAGAAADVTGPAADVVRAWADLQLQQPALRPHLRYLSAYATPEADRAELARVLSFWVNSLSREAELVPPAQVAPGLWRVNLLDYGWDPVVWERLAGVDPYFHVKLRRTVTVRSRSTGRTFRRDRIVDAAAPWLPPGASAGLTEQTQSAAPIVRADWFLYRTAIQAGREGHGYYDFLGLGKKEKDFQELVGVDERLARKARKEIAAVVARSSVTLNNRGIKRLGAVTGGYWYTQDYKTSTDRQNTLRLLDGDAEPPEGDASEQYGTLPNGLFAFWLQNGKGERQDTAPDFIAGDGQATDTDRRVHIGLSCIRCHVEGIRPINDWARQVYHGALSLQSPDYAKLVRLRQLYLSDLEGHVKADQEAYARALGRACGLKPAELARAYAAAWHAYAERDLGLEDAARELGCTPQQLVAALDAQLKATGRLDPVLAGLIQKPPVAVRREHFEELYGVLQSALRGIALP